MSSSIYFVLSFLYYLALHECLHILLTLASKGIHFLPVNLHRYTQDIVYSSNNHMLPLFFFCITPSILHSHGVYFSLLISFSPISACPHLRTCDMRLQCLQTTIMVFNHVPFRLLWSCISSRKGLFRDIQRGILLAISFWYLDVSPLMKFNDFLWCNLSVLFFYCIVNHEPQMAQAFNLCAETVFIAHHLFLGGVGGGAICVWLTLC